MMPELRDCLVGFVDAPVPNGGVGAEHFADGAQSVINGILA